MEADEYRRMAEMEEAHWWYSATRAVLRQELAPRLAPGSRLLDAGGGTGATGAWMSEFGSVVTADFEPRALTLLRELHGDGGGLAVADVGALPFAAGSFDLGLCVTVLCHRSIADPVAAVRELARVVRPGGTVALLEPGVRRLRRAHDRETHTGRRFARSDLHRIATEAGLRVERSTGVHSYLVPAAAVKAVLERGRSSSDLDQGATGLGGILGTAASLERRVLRRAALPFGLSVMVIATRR